MKFHAVCLSPALDATVLLDHAPSGTGEVFKDVAETVNVGGKGINVARWLAYRGADVSCSGLLGEANERPFGSVLAAYGIRDAFRRVSGETRRNEMITWPGGSMKLNRAAFPQVTEVPQPEEILADVDRDTVCILSGSLPTCCAPDYYAACVAVAKARGARVVLDASGAPLVAAVRPTGTLVAFPDVIKPNADECEPLVGFVPKTPEEFRRATAILNEYVPTVIISDGGAGCWFNGEFVPAPSVHVVDTTAAGDTLLAEWCWRTFGEKETDAAAWAVAAGSAACTMPGGDPPTFACVAELKKCEG